MDQDQSQDSDEHTRKSRKFDDDTNNDTNDKGLQRGMDKSISPPPLRRRRMERLRQMVPENKMESLEQMIPEDSLKEMIPDYKMENLKQMVPENSLKEMIPEDRVESPKQMVPENNLKQMVPENKKESLKQMVPDNKMESPKQKVVKSPFQLTTIQDLPASSNVDTVSLKDLLGDPLISECWEFNYLHNLDFLMEQFDEDVQNLVKVNVVHGFWKREDQSRFNLKEQALKYPNIKLLTAYMPEMFGTHHSKMLILFRHDFTAQVIIHTANMIPFDWTNMTQAVWKSPLLPLLNQENPILIESNEMGSGSKFKKDLLNYLRAYDTRRVICKPLIEQLLKHDFSEIRAALVASALGKQDIEIDSTETAWGWPGLTNVLKFVPCSKAQAEIVVQISSIASLGTTDKWLNQTFFKALADEIRRSLNGYASGNAIHTKILTPAQLKQLAYLKPMLHHWAGDGPQHTSPSQPSSQPEPTTPSNTNSLPQNPSISPQNALRKRAAPHIKTYIRFSDHTHTNKSIDWILVTSANLSKQAWGENVNVAGEVRVCSYEIGVLVWPGLWGEGEGEGERERARMVPCFGGDVPDIEGERAGGKSVGEENVEGTEEGTEEEGKEISENNILIGARIPYDLPITPYGINDIPWCATATYAEPDWMGNTWNT
ncbi:hypothetical protein SBOR_7812 [Sclerotinia borealis F-4128]|uniref:Tyrosyl-DNA phosphodiesterase n=1 Tax=Sclerotinia borealis (strain F-4128) TaxID=1432307 RepID=W9C7J3_SCLBF|nr:hypothetical protein SBOR_7812 [Sclerotinia borealis F-4128]